MDLYTAAWKKTKGLERFAGYEKWINDLEADGRLTPEQAASRQAGVEAVRDANVEEVKGRLYTVSLDVEPHELLDWDKPLYQQSGKVKAALESLGIKTVPRGQYTVTPSTKGDKWTVRNPWGESVGTFSDRSKAEAKAAQRTESFNKGSAELAYVNLGGNPIYSNLDKGEASQKLCEVGIPGIRYLDQGSRAAGGGSHNYVIFPGAEDRIKITAKDGKPVSDAEREDVLHQTQEEQKLQFAILGGIDRDKLFKPLVPSRAFWDEVKPFDALLKGEAGRGGIGMPREEYQASSQGRPGSPAVAGAGIERQKPAPPSSDLSPQIIRGLLNRGRGVSIPERAVQEGLTVLRAFQREFPPITPCGTLTRIEPLGGPGGKLAQLFFASPDGKRFTVRTERSNLGVRALYLPKNGFIGLLHGGVGRRGPVQELVSSLSGEIRHELVHALRRLGLFTGGEWLVLVRHAQNLNILDWELRHYLRLVKAPNNASAGVTVRAVYEKGYANEPDKSVLLEEEAVSHAVEAYHHISQLPNDHPLRQGLLPLYREVEPILEKLFTGEIAGRSPGQVLAFDAGEIPAIENRRPVFAFAGARAKTANLASLDIAQRMLEGGKPAEAVYRATGWFKPPFEDKWYWEISDHEARLVNVQAHLRPNTEGRRLLLFGRDARRGAGWAKGDVRWGVNIPLPQILHHPALFEAYPFLEKMRLNMFVGRDIPEDLAGSGALVHRKGANGGIVYSPIRVIAKDAREALTVLLHEIQHYIQQKEQFAEGSAVLRPSWMRPPGTPKGTPTYVTNQPLANEWWAGGIIRPTEPEGIMIRINALRDAAQGRDFDALRADHAGSLLAEKSDAELQDYARQVLPQEVGRLEKSLRLRASTYERSAGEYVARRTEERIGMAPSERRQRLPFADAPGNLTAQRQTKDFQEAAAAVARHAALWEDIRKRWKAPVDLGNGISVVREGEDRWAFRSGEAEPQLAVMRFRVFGSGNYEFSASEALYQMPHHEAVNLIRRAEGYMRRRNIIPEVPRRPASGPAAALWEEVYPEIKILSFSSYREEVNRLAEEKYGKGATVDSDGQVYKDEYELYDENGDHVILEHDILVPWNNEIFGEHLLAPVDQELARLDRAWRQAEWNRERRARAKQEAEQTGTVFGIRMPWAKEYAESASDAALAAKETQFLSGRLSLSKEGNMRYALGGSVNDNGSNVVRLETPIETDEKYNLLNHESRIKRLYEDHYGPGTQVNVAEAGVEIVKPKAYLVREVQAALAKLDEIDFTEVDQQEFWELLERVNPRKGYTLDIGGARVEYRGDYNDLTTRIERQFQSMGLTDRQAASAAIVLLRTTHLPLDFKETLDQLASHRQDLLAPADYLQLVAFFKGAKVEFVGAAAPGEVARYVHLERQFENWREAKCELQEASHDHKERFPGDVERDYEAKHGRNIFNEPLAPRAFQKPAAAILAGRVLYAIGGEPDIEVQDTDVYDMHRGEMFGTKSIVKDGKPVAAVDLSIVGKEVHITFIRSAQGRQGYATTLVDDLFREYPGYKIFLTNMTEEGSKFFLACYDVSENGEIAPKAGRAAAPASSAISQKAGFAVGGEMQGAGLTWKMAVAEELQGVRAKAQRILAKIERRKGALEQQIEELHQAPPANPRGLAAILPGAQQRYEDWMRQRAGLFDALKRAKEHKQRVGGYLEYGVEGYSSRSELLAQRKAELRHPQLAKEERIGQERQQKLRLEVTRRKANERKCGQQRGGSGR